MYLIRGDLNAWATYSVNALALDFGLASSPIKAQEASASGMRFPELFRIDRNEDHVSKHFERWKELATLTSKEQDPAKLTELANEMNLVLTQKELYLDPPLREPL